MEWKKIGKRLLFPHPAIVVLLSVCAAAFLVYSFLALDEADPISIAAYALSFYALMLVCLQIPTILRWIQRFRHENKHYLRYQSDVQLRINLSLYGAFGFNALYALFQLCLGLRHRSAWFYAMAVYYLLLAVMRLTLARHTSHYAAGEDNANEWRKYCFCGWLLLVMNLALAVFTLYFVFRIRTFPHHEITTIAMAAYTFAALTMAIINVIRYRNYGRPAYSAAKAISLASATVSMLTLENALLTTFGQESDELFRRIILGASGIIVILVVQGIALNMIVNACRRLRMNRSHI